MTVHTLTPKGQLCVKCQAQLIQPEVINDALPHGHHAALMACGADVAEYLNELRDWHGQHYDQWDGQELARRVIDRYRVVLKATMERELWERR